MAYWIGYGIVVTWIIYALFSFFLKHDKGFKVSIFFCLAICGYNISNDVVEPIALLFVIIGLVLIHCIDKIKIKHTKDNDHNDLKLMSKKLKKVELLTNEAMKDKDYTSLYGFQQVCLPKVLFECSDKLISKNELQIHFILSEFSKINGGFSLDINNIDVEHFEFNEYNIFKVSIIDMDEVVKIARKTTLCNIIYLCFDLQVSSNNKIYYSEMNEDISETLKYVFCSRTNDGIHWNHGTFDFEISIDQVKNILYSNEKNMETDFSDNVDKLVISLNEIFQKNSIDVIMIDLLLLTTILNHFRMNNEKYLIDDYLDLFEKYEISIEYNELEQYINELLIVCEDPSLYYLGQMFSVLPPQDINVINEMENVKYGALILFFIDKIYFNYNTVEEAKHPHITSPIDLMKKMQSFLRLRNELWDFIHHYMK